MSDTRTTRPAGSDEPFAQRWGLSGGYCLVVPISTSISDGGLGHCAQLSLDIAESFEERYAVVLEFDGTENEAKLLPSTEATGTTSPRSHYAFTVGMGKTSRIAPLYGADRRLAAALAFSTTPLLGFGSSTLGGGSRELDGESFAFDATKATTFDIKTNYSLLGEFRPWGRGPQILFGPEFSYGVQYAGPFSEHNRVGLDLMLTLKLGYGDASSLSGADIDTEIGAMGIAQGAFATIHGWMQRWAMNAILAAPQEKLADYDLESGGGNRGSLANVPLLESAAAFAGAMGGGMAPALRSNEAWFWAFTAAQAVGGVGFLFSDNDAGRSAGVADLLGAARLASFAIAGIETPGKRLTLDPSAVRQREAFINLASYALNAAFLVGGGLGGSDLVARSGVGTNLQIAFSPDPTERGLTESTLVSLIPVSYVSGGGKSGMRSGIRIHQSWRDLPLPGFQLFSSVLFLSPMIRPDNLANHATQSDPYGSPELNSDVSATLGLEWRTDWTRLYFGIDTKGIFGSADQKAGIGGVAGFDLTIPIAKRWQLTAGVMGSAHATFPRGSQFEVMPTVGIEYRSR